ncbi:MarR family winged helix-turn-helix transcriptional regulator [Desulfosporosinus sp. BICA1-9]|uniref:MarR family winged helix-turn-helix transcriptional regulator n=1 Tax=Desulfosporosinus sp. BICA1-9 TaxID=1531958 RepID=UPI00054C4EA2|nr:MarR family transcriptional regulator [Desulfosporosinus sp. BICA1-9]KJS47851.1 MAG: transcriptional regulator [Peptococcaceae bacterium BRH_c23]KJS90411.1 MAG: transcriptional regulator [Desulfosporosinus sp. BICA1-9]HBW35811.1 MarR family transcriptional regulator [Desulfosporosinus sp.]
MAPTEELTKQLEETLRQADTILFKRGRSILMDMEISALQFNALLTIREFGSLTMGDLCKNLFVACSTATDLADRMERSELVERVRDDKDRRVVKLHLLARGNQVLEAVIAERQNFLGEVLRDYTDEEYEELLHGLHLLTQRMELK